MTHSRHDMNNTLTSLTLEALVSPVLTPDRLVMEHCLLISLLHANVGSEVGKYRCHSINCHYRWLRFLPLVFHLLPPSRA